MTKEVKETINRLSTMPSEEYYGEHDSKSDIELLAETIEELERAKFKIIK